MTKKLNFEMAQMIIDEYFDGIKSQDLSEKYKISGKQVRNIISGKQWAGCSRPLDWANLIKKRVVDGRFQRGISNYWDRDFVEKLPPLSKHQWNLLNGSLLGDGSLIPTTANYRFRKMHGIKQKEYVEWVANELSPYVAGVYKTKSQQPYMNTYSLPIFTELRQKWYPHGIKKIPIDLEINPEIIAIWFADDGTNSGTQISLATDCFTKEEVLWLCDKLAIFKLQTSLGNIKLLSGASAYRVLLSGPSYRNFVDLVSPYLQLSCLSYKLKMKSIIKVMRHRLKPEEIVDIYQLKHKCTRRSLAKKYNVTLCQISNIWSGRAWRNITSSL